MLTKNTLLALFKKNKNVNFVINTNIFEGGGVNGVNATQFYGFIDHLEYGETTQIRGFADEYMLIRVDSRRNFWSYGCREIYLPYTSILSVEFRAQSPYHSKQYPLYLPFDHELKELK